MFISAKLRLETTVYGTRAWTQVHDSLPVATPIKHVPSFQEHLLSRRNVIFFDNEVAFQCCRSERWRACRDVPNPERNATSSLKSGKPRWATIEYGYSVMSYTQHALSNQSDAIRALAGILLRLSHGFRYRMLEGLPTGAFDLFILFSGTNLCRRRGFPSYFWAG